MCQLSEIRKNLKRKQGTLEKTTSQAQLQQSKKACLIQFNLQFKCKQ